MWKWRKILRAGKGLDQHLTPENTHSETMQHEQEMYLCCFKLLKFRVITYAYLMYAGWCNKLSLILQNDSNLPRRTGRDDYSNQRDSKKKDIESGSV